MRIYDNFLLYKGKSKNFENILEHLENLIHNLYLNIESLQKDFSQLSIPSKNLYQVYNNQKYSNLKNKFENYKTDDKNSLNKSDFSKEFNFSQNSEQLIDNPKNKEKSFDSFSEIGIKHFDLNTFEFNKIKSHSDFSNHKNSSFTNIENFLLDFGWCHNVFIEPGTIFVKKFLVLQSQIDQSEKNFLLFSYKVYLIR